MSTIVPAPPDRRAGQRRHLLLAIALVALNVRPAEAKPRVQQPPQPPPVDETAQPDFVSGLWTQGSLLGDLGGLRTLFGDYGVTISVQETEEMLGNVTGGTRDGFEYDGLTVLSLGIDAQKAFGLDGGAFDVSALQIHGRNLSSDNLQTLQTASGIEAQGTTRLWELWYQQSFSDLGLDIRLGLQSIDQDFMVSAGSSLFINTMMGWPMVPSADLYAGGPAYPLSSVGIRLRAHSIGPFTVLAGAFDDNPPGGPFYDDSQSRGAERTGTRFNLGTGTLFIAEVQYALNPPTAGNTDDGAAATRLLGTYELGAWFDTASFPDQRFDAVGRSLASPFSNDVPLMHRHNYSFYGMFDQAVWRAGVARIVGVFARIMGAPGDRNLISFSVNAGVTMKAPLARRDNDTIGIGWGIAKVGSHVTALDRDTNTFSFYSPIRTTENFIEVTYQFQAAGWWQIQPDFQYVFTPGGGIPDSRGSARRIANEAVFGVRTNIAF